MIGWKRGDVAWVDHGDHVTIVRLAAPIDAPRVLEGSAAEIWHALDAHPRSTKDLATRIGEALHVPADVVEPDLQDFLHTLEAEQIAVSTEEEGA